MSGRSLRTHHLPSFTLESGEVLTDVVQAYHLDGELNAERDNLVIVFHALTGSADAVGDWWSTIMGPGRPIDTDRYAILCANLLGSCYGTTFRRAEPGGRPEITPRDQARLIHALVATLEVPSVALTVGGSLGGMVGMEWAALYPDLTRCSVVLAAPAAHTASAIGWNHIQRQAIALGSDQGLAVARMVGMMTYRTAAEFQLRFGRDRGPQGFQVESYLDHQGRKLVRRFEVESYLMLMGAMDAHDVGRDRGGVAAALRRVRGRLSGVGIPGDILYTDSDVRAWTDAVGADYRRIDSIHGHDAFLIEVDQVAAILNEALEETSTPVRLFTGA
jgi:homoserine O-acetyltransferase/O-succinyltransferase